MVASDTIVGLIGAGVLIVALIGVFVYENEEVAGSSSKKLEHKTYSMTADGTYISKKTNLPLCNPPAPPTAVCTGSTEIYLNVTGLDNMPATPLILFGRAGTTTVRINTVDGGMDRSGDKYVYHNTEAVFHDYTEITLSIEKDAAATVPTWPLFTFTVTPSSETRLDKPATKFDFGGSDQEGQTVTFSGRTVEAVLKGFTPRTGYAAHGWLSKESGSGLTYEYVGEYKASGDSGTIKGNATKASDYFSFVVSLEPKAHGTVPGGPVTYEAQIKAKAAGTSPSPTTSPTGPAPKPGGNQTFSIW